VPDSELGDTGKEETADVGAAAVVGADGGELQLSEAAMAALPAEVFAESIGDYFRAWGRRLRNGESGALPVILGLVAIIIFFQLEQSVFLTSGNLTNLFIEASVYVMFGLAELFALLLSEIDLSIGYLAALGAFIIAELNQPPVFLPWWVGVLAGIGFCTVWGVMQGTLITRLGLPSFVVTLGGLLACEGLVQVIANADPQALGGGIQLNGNAPVYKLVGSHMPIAAGWIVLAVGLVIFTVMSLRKAQRLRKQGLAAPPLGVTLLMVGLTAVAGIFVVWICNSNGGLGVLAGAKGVPWVIPFVVIVLLLWTFVLGRTKIGRYIYAIGANPEAARRAGINVPLVRTFGFAMCGLMAGVAGMVYASNLGSISTDVDGGNLVLFAVAAAVIGGASLFGGRGKALNALLGGLVIAVVVNGLALMSVSAAVQDIVTAVVLIAAVTLDAVVRRRATAH
jgi:D-xylose transport system permease protein